MKLVFATHNKNKIKEIKNLIPGKYNILSLEDIRFFEDIPETAPTIQENASLKARFIFDKYNISCFADDTGLEIEALEGRPGVYSARYAGASKSSKDNMTKVLAEMQGIVNRNARFKTVISLIIEGKEAIFEGVITGEITENIIGHEGFGYDPIFKPAGYEKTFAQMTLEDKNKISHRALAVNKLVDYLSKLG